MGTILSRKSFPTAMWQQQQQQVTPHDGSYRWEEPPHDYRDVVLVRHLYDATLSGYLYHRSGRECWLNTKGRPPKNAWLINHADMYWDNVADSISRLGLPPRQNRTLCHYLQQESLGDGLLLYAEIAVQTWYRNLYRNFQYARTTRDDRNRTLFVCYSDFASRNRTVHAEMVKSVVDFLFPTGHNFTLLEPSEAERLSAKVQPAGGHATSKDPAVIIPALRQMARIDQTYYNGSIGFMANHMGCPSQHRWTLNGETI
jgi:hypothetical protein